MINITYIDHETRYHFTMRNYAVLLEARGLNPALTIYPTGQEALVDLHNGAARPELIFLDLALPDVPAVDLIRQLRRHPRLARTPIIGLANYSAPLDPQHIKRMGCDHYLLKPIRYQAVEDTIFQHVARL